MSRAKNKKWFIAVRGSYLPNCWIGWLLYVPFISYLVFTLVYGIVDTSSWPKEILFIVPNWVAATAIMTWIAAHTS